MAFRAFLQLEGIDSESTDSKHSDWMEILSFSHGVSQRTSGSFSSNGAPLGEGADVSDFSIVKRLDKSSPKLAQHCIMGKASPTGTLEICRAIGDATEECYMKYEFENAVITSVRPGGASGGAESVPLEEVSFTFSKITWTYKETEHGPGTAGGEVPAYYQLDTHEVG